jgi:hypothetical protein
MAPLLLEEGGESAKAMPRSGVVLAVAAGVLLGAGSAKIAAPKNLPEALKAPAGVHPMMKLHAKGAQLYACKEADAGSYAWGLVAPQAELFPTGPAKVGAVGEHFAGPSWRWKADQSEFVGNGAQAVKAPAPDNAKGNIPWLLVPKKGGTDGGVFGAVTYIQRVNTRGGVAPSDGCSAATLSADAGVSYEADYIFYAND